MSMNPPRYEAHVTDDWQRDAQVIQVRMIAPNGGTMAIGQVLEDTDGVPVMQFKQLPPDYYDGREHLEPTPGIRLRNDAAVAIARAILTGAGADTDEVERLRVREAHLTEALQGAEASASRHLAKADDLQNQVDLLERLVQTLEAAADREARVADHFHESLEHQRRDDRHEQDRRFHPSRTLEDVDAAYRRGVERGLAGD